jgi:diguanylate cyclase (GGDEF)-like protein
MDQNNEGRERSDELIFSAKNELTNSQDLDSQPIFAAEQCSFPVTTETSPSSESQPWKVMIVDDDNDIHTTTKLLLKEFTFKDSHLIFLHAHSSAEARELINEHPDTAIIFLDVVMEHDSAGLEVVRHIRDEMGNRFIRIILRTGQPGQTPEMDVLTNYDINDYLDKGSMSYIRLFSCLTTSLRTYEVLLDLEQMRKKVQESEEFTQRSYQTRMAISAMLETAMEPLSLSRQLEVALDIILTIPWLTILNKGSIFLFDAEKSELQMAAQRNLSESLLSNCKILPMGHCLCGRAAQTREIVFSQHIDERHDVMYDGITPHGHYCVPILSQGKLLGVLNIYVHDGHKHKPEEDAFMVTIANTLAGVIERRNMETKLCKAEERLKELAHHDDLTGLPNRLLFVELLRSSLSLSRRDKSKIALMFMDLDRFKAVNDTYGHDVGDSVLKEAGARIISCLRECDTVARMGGDEFTILLPEVDDESKLSVVAGRIVEKISRPFNIAGNECFIGTSIGISVFPEHGDTPDILIRSADQAMYAVKKCGRNNFMFYSKDKMEN